MEGAKAAREEEPPPLDAFKRVLLLLLLLELLLLVLLLLLELNWAEAKGTKREAEAKPAPGWLARSASPLAARIRSPSSSLPALLW